jgi:DNA-binding NarL/FixJ family response regulator
VTAVLRRECYLDSPVAAHIFDEFVKQPSPGLTQSAPLSVLTAREVEILRLVVDGLSSKDIAAKLFLSPKTVENHRSNIMAKLGLHDVIDLVKYALANGLVDPETWSR